MRRKLVLGAGLVAFVGGSAAAQFAVDRPQTAAPLPGGVQPAAAPPAPVLGGYQPLTPPSAPTSPSAPMYSSPTAPRGGAYVPPVDGLRPATYGSQTSLYGSPAPAPGVVPAAASLPVHIEIPTVLGKDHPWLIKPEHGPYFIMVKSYVRPAKDSRAAKEALERGEKGLSARELAEGLAAEIRDTYKVQAFLYEYISEERKAEERALIIARQKARTEYVGQLDAIKQKAQIQGMDFLDPDNKLRVRKHDQFDQIGVLVGGFQTDTDASKALVQLKKWPTPKNEVLLDKGLVLNTTGTKPSAESGSINPYPGAFVVPNPVIARATQPTGQAAAVDPFLKKLNDAHPYNLFKATKGWTLAVKSFTAPVEIVNKSDSGQMRKMAAGKGAEALLAGELQAEEMAKAIRAMKGPGGQSLNLEAFVLHTRTASLVTIGQFDSPDDPALLATKRLLSGLSAHVSEDQAGARKSVNAPTLFDNMIPMPVPKS
ncbi:hypothetical protein [Frigoriglobus tundricola]|uniref:SPOR domain-containing protein n=1 Tax=Frigoriglobus tundricola TaxID=2774151 RepID=A0A6M5YRD9_9BACT|nr:hypothetical protein [Frigoriglobus tundricola]QJW96004.1 hypothetical protein FTUN_3558 [Frigoriglobus tundricola]